MLDNQSSQGHRFQGAIVAILSSGIRTGHAYLPGSFLHGCGANIGSGKREGRRSTSSRTGIEFLEAETSSLEAEITETRGAF